MRHALQLLAMLMAVGALPAAEDRTAIPRLDGSTIGAGEIDGTVMRLMKAAEVTGAGIAVINDGKIAYLKTCGFRDKDNNLPLTADSVMSAASFTKVAFAYVVMELVRSNESSSTQMNLPSMQTRAVDGGLGAS